LRLTSGSVTVGKLDILEQIIKLMFTDSARLDSFLFMLWSRSRQVLIRGVVFFRKEKEREEKDLDKATGWWYMGGWWKRNSV